ncbi:MAG TPA: DUF4412 domain-containing protein [Thermoanaerobaculia bacterium]|nr:DUF4412 domain-containing protein [Thermoanaerobaculia bacterium]
MRKSSSIVLGAALFVAAAPAFAGIHYKSTTKSDGPRGQGNEVQVEGWVAGEKARVEFKDSTSPNPVTQKGTYLLTKDGGKTLYLVNPEEKTYAVLDLSAMLGTVGTVMNGMGPLLKIQFSEPKVEKLADEDGGTVAGVPAHHTQYRTSYTTTVKVLGMGRSSSVVTEQDFWTTTKLVDPGMGVWLRAEPPRTGNPDFDRLLTAEKYKLQGYPLKMVTVTTNTDSKNGRVTTSHSSMEVTQLETSATVPASSFELPAGYKETQLMSTKPEGVRE